MDINLTTVEAAASAAESVLEKVMSVEPVIASTVGIFVPEMALAQPYILAAMPGVEKALKAVAAGNGGDMVSAVAEVLKHLLPGQPNSPALSAGSNTQQASQQASG